MTNKQSWCVEQAVNWALLSLHESGKLDLLFAEYFPPVSCPSADVEDNDRSLDIPDLAGLFLCYAVVAVIVIIARTSWFCENFIIKRFSPDAETPLDPAQERPWGGGESEISEAAPDLDAFQQAVLHRLNRIEARFEQFPADLEGKENSGEDSNPLQAAAIECELAMMPGGPQAPDLVFR